MAMTITHDGVDHLRKWLKGGIFMTLHSVQFGEGSAITKKTDKALDDIIPYGDIRSKVTSNGTVLVTQSVLGVGGAYRGKNPSNQGLDGTGYIGSKDDVYAIEDNKNGTLAVSFIVGPSFPSNLGATITEMGVRSLDASSSSTTTDVTKLFARELFSTGAVKGTNTEWRVKLTLTLSNEVI